MKKWIFSLLLVLVLLTGCQNKTPDKKVIDSEAWPDSKVVTYLPIFIKGKYTSSNCNDTDCEIIFKNVEQVSFEEYVASLIDWNYIVNSSRKTEDKLEIYEASNEYFAYVKVGYDTENKTFTINNSIKEMKK